MEYKELWNITNGGGWTSIDDTEYKLVRVGNQLYVFFLGSITAKDWLHNFMFWPFSYKKPYKDMKNFWLAHRGFLKKWKTIQDRVISDIQAQKNYDELIIVGHSQGGALACLCMEDCVFRGIHDNIRGITFGSPKPFYWFNTKGVKERLKNMTHVMGTLDIVPTQPFWLWGYRKFGVTQKIKSKYNIFRIQKNHVFYGDIF